MNEYRSRIADKMLRESLEAMGGVLVQGTKWCGKCALYGRSRHKRAKPYLGSMELAVLR